MAARTTTSRFTVADKAEIAALVMAMLDAREGAVSVEAPKATVPAKARRTVAPKAQPTPEAPKGRLLPGKWETVTLRSGESYRRRVPNANAKLGAKATGVATDKPGAKVGERVVMESKAGAKYWGFAKA